MSVCLGVLVMGITPKSIVEKTPMFHILQLYHMQILLEIFYEDRKNNLCTGAHKTPSNISMNGLNFLKVHSIVFRPYEIR